MEYIILLLVAALVFSICFLVDKGFKKVFRNQQQHHSGTAVRLSRRYGSIGLIMTVLGVAGVLSGLSDSVLMVVCGGILIVTGLALVVYYMSFGVFYDEDAFVYTSLGKKSITYQYHQIKAQQLYNSYGSIVIELQMTDGRAISLQASMDGVYPFLDKAFSRWLAQTGRNEADCPFYDPQNSCWFPPVED